MKQSPAFHFAAAALLTATGTVLFAQEAPPGDTSQAGEAPASQAFGEQISVDVVNLEVWVSDKEGNPVPGLSKGDFRLFEDGKPVEISNFSSYSTRTETRPVAPEAAEAPAPAPSPTRELALAPELAAAPEAPASAENRLYLVVLLDNWTVRPEDRGRAIDGLRDFLDHHLGPGDQVMIAAHDRSIQLVQRFTSDPQALARALDRVAESSPAGVQLRSDRRSALNAIKEAYQAVANGNAKGGRTGGEDPCEKAWGDMEAAATGYAANLQGVYEQSGGALVSMTQILAGVPGRKMLLYVGGSLEQTPGIDILHYLGEICPHHQSDIALQFTNYDLTWLYRDVTKAANAARVTLYTLEAATPGGDQDLSMAGPIGGLSGIAGYDSRTDPNKQGSGGGGLGGGGNAGGGGSGGRIGATGVSGPAVSHGQTFRPSTALQHFGELNKEDGLVYLAHETGGRSILNAGDFKPDLARVGSDLRSYYSLGFTPSHRGDGKVHHLEVKVPGGDGYEVRYRRSYVDEAVDQRMAERVRGVAQFGTESNPLRVRIETGEPTPTPTGTFRVPVRLWVPVDAITVLPKDGKSSGSLRLLLAYSDAHGKLGPVRQKEVPISVVASPAQAGEAGQPPSPRERLIEVGLDLAPGPHELAIGLRDELGGEVSYLRHRVDVGSGAQEQTANPPR